VCHFCGHKFIPDEPAEQRRDAAVRQAAALERPKLAAEFFEVNGHVHRPEGDGSTSAINGGGERIKFPN